MKTLWTIVKYNLNSEYRNLSQSLAILLFAWIVSYILFRVHPSMQPMHFGFLYWTFLMLLSINICLRAESHHGSDEHLFLYTCTEPTHILLAKILFNFFYLMVIGLLFYGFYLLYFSEQLSLNVPFIGVIIMGAFSISACLSFVATMASYADGQNTLISVLALPLLIPVILILKSMTDEIILFENIEYLKYLTLLSISLITIALSIILFPFIWKQ